MRKVLSATIKIPRQSLKKGVVLLDLNEYHKLQTASVPTYYLNGAKALALDRLVEQGLREHHLGKTRKIRSLAELR